MCFSDMIKTSIDDFCIESVFSYCDRTCDKLVHLPPNIPVYDGHIHLNEASSPEIDYLLSIRKDLCYREFHFIENHHKPSRWLDLQPLPSSSHIRMYSTIGIHPKYFDVTSMQQDLELLYEHLRKSNDHESQRRFVAVGECGLDETSPATIEQQLFVLEKQIDFSVHFSLPLVLHCRGVHLYAKLFRCLMNRLSDRYMKIHWHCINVDADLDVVDQFLHVFPNDYVGLNGSITYERNDYRSSCFKHWLIDRSQFLSSRLILETDFPHLPPRNLRGIYEPSCGLVATNFYLEKLIENSDQPSFSFLYSSNANIKHMYSL